MNPLDILLLLALAAVVVLALRRIRRSRRGGCSCTGGCAGCNLGCGQRRTLSEEPYSRREKE
ncbi:MAG: FeoB-associated Cys-rich membrane protein [Desulfovibrio sp.]|nr:FeoB-associated Cys-rich membrane protein [Desulfovibrio sp.]